MKKGLVPLLLAAFIALGGEARAVLPVGVALGVNLDLVSQQGKGMVPKILPDAFTTCDDGGLSMVDPNNAQVYPLPVIDVPCTFFVSLTPDGYLGDGKDQQGAKFFYSLNGRGFQPVLDSSVLGKDTHIDDRSWVIPVNLSNLNPGPVRIMVKGTVISGTSRSEYLWKIIKGHSHDRKDQVGYSDLFLAAEYPKVLPKDREAIATWQEEMIKEITGSGLPLIFTPQSVIDRVKARLQPPAAAIPPSAPPSSTVSPPNPSSSSHTDTVSPASNGKLYSFKYMSDQKKVQVSLLQPYFRITVQYKGQKVRSERLGKVLDRVEYDSSSLKVGDVLTLDWASNLEVTIQEQVDGVVEVLSAVVLQKGEGNG